MFASIEQAPPDPILGLTEAFKADPNPAKINLGVGIYKDAQGHTPVLPSVKEAEHRLLTGEDTKSYLPITGDAVYAQCVQNLLFGQGADIPSTHRAATAQTPGGTAALRVAGDYLHAQHPSATLWVSDPTWDNHMGVFAASGVPTKKYPYYNPATRSLAFDVFIDALNQIPAGDVILLHGCCHNPSGVDPTAAQWQQIAQVLADREILPLVDFAYQGFGEGVDEDALGLRTIADTCPELLICSSFSKNFGLYNERVGAFTAVAETPAAAKAVMSQAATCIRRNYSNPPAHGAAIVRTILTDAHLTEQWLDEVKQMRDRINGMRSLFVQTLAQKGVPGDFSFITRQRGMFSFSGLNRDQVACLRDKFAIYIVGSGRINVAGMTEKNMAPLCQAIASVV
jgi:aspartate/tyrosine/aromatic aminotransferase